jgi:nucleotide-binding universal stress UspA family protein
MVALDWAAGEARLRGAALIVVHAEFARSEFLRLYTDLELGERRVLEAAVERARNVAPEIVVTGVLHEPPAGTALVAASRGADLLVVGSRGLGGLEVISMGSVSQECAHRAHCPVAIVRPTPDKHGGDANLVRSVGSRSD